MQTKKNVLKNILIYLFIYFIKYVLDIIIGINFYQNLTKYNYHFKIMFYIKRYKQQISLVIEQLHLSFLSYKIYS